MQGPAAASQSQSRISNRSRGPPVVSVLPLGWHSLQTLGLQTIYNHGQNCHFCNEILPRYAFEYHHPWLCREPQAWNSFHPWVKSSCPSVSPHMATSHHGPDPICYIVLPARALSTSGLSPSSEIIFWSFDPLICWSTDLLVHWSDDPMIRWSTDPLWSIISECPKCILVVHPLCILWLPYCNLEIYIWLLLSTS